MRYVKAYLAGVAFPATIMPFAYYLIFSVETLAPARGVPFPIIPLLWGLWNVAHVALGDHWPIKDRNLRLWATGATLGFIVGLLIVYVYQLPAAFGFPGWFHYFPLIGVPLVWGFFWRYVVGPLNALVGLKDR